MNLRVEKHYDLAEKILRKVIIQLRSSKSPDKVYEPVTISVLTYKNGRENGYQVVIGLYEQEIGVDYRGVTFSRNRNGEHIVVYWLEGSLDCFGMLGITEELRARCSMLLEDEIDLAVTAIVHFLVLGKIIIPRGK